MEIRTGYFAQTKKYESLGYMPISIALRTPDWFDGLKTTGLSPNNVLLGKFKNKEITEENFKVFYLAGLKPSVIEMYIEAWSECCDIDSTIKGVVLMCYEKPESVCHRHYLAEYITKEYGIEVTELVV